MNVIFQYFGKIILVLLYSNDVKVSVIMYADDLVLIAKKQTWPATRNECVT